MRCLPCFKVHLHNQSFWVHNPKVSNINRIKDQRSISNNDISFRYVPLVAKIKEIIDSGVLGEIITINHFENIGFYHFAHSYVRGNWKNEATSTFSLLAKSCHDLDLLQYWMGDKKCIQVITK